MIRQAIAAVVLLELCYAALLVILFMRTLGRRATLRRRVRISEAKRPAIREALIEYLAGCANLALLREYGKTNRRDLSDCVLELHTAVSGGARERLWEIGLELALVHDWCEETRSRDRALRCLAFERLALACAFEPCRRIAGDLQLSGIQDPDPDVRFAAARGLAYSDDIKDVERVFELAVGQNNLARVLLTEVLRRHAVALCETVVPGVLRSGDEQRVMSALEIVVAWERAVPLLEVFRLVLAGSPEIRRLALRTLPLVPASPENESAVLSALSDEHRDIAKEAITTAGRLRLESAIPRLTHYLKWDSPELSRAAAEALAAIPPHGWEILNEFGPPPAAAPPPRERKRERKAARV